MFDLRSLTRAQRQARAEQFPPDTEDDRLIADLTCLCDDFAQASRNVLDEVAATGRVDPFTQQRLSHLLARWQERA